MQDFLRNYCIIKAVVSIYSKWLTCLITQVKFTIKVYIFTFKGIPSRGCSPSSQESALKTSDSRSIHQSDALADVLDKSGTQSETSWYVFEKLVTLAILESNF